MSFFLSGFPIPDTQDIGDSLPYINKSLFNLDVAVALLSAGGREFATLTSLVIATDGSSSYFLSNYVNGIADNYIVYLDGVKQLPYADYTINAATSSIVFPSPAPSDGITLEVIRAVAVISYTEDATKLPLAGGTLFGSLCASTYYGDGSNLTGITTKDKLPLAGGTLSGPLVGTEAVFLNEGDLVSRETSRVWRDVALSYNGAVQAAVVQGSGRIYVSRNSGNTWVAKESTRSWISIAISHDGSILTAATSNSSIFISFDFGDNWDETAFLRPWREVAMSSNGQYQTATTVDSQITPGGGQIYISSDSGSSWTPKILDANRNWYGVAVSSNGSKQTAIANQGQIYTSSDYGNTWTAKDENRNWVGIAMSSDGTTQTAVVEGGQIYVSNNSGETWVPKDDIRNWKSVSMSSDGTRQVAIVLDLVGSSDGYIYFSTDSGNTWTARMADASRAWNAVAMSPDGTKTTAGLYNGTLYANKASLEIKSGTLFADSATLYTYLSAPTINTKTVQLTGAVFVDTGSLRLRYGTLTLDGSNINNPYGSISTGSITFANGLYSLNSTGLATARAGLFVQEVTASAFVGDGSKLTGINSSQYALSADLVQVLQLPYIEERTSPIISAGYYHVLALTNTGKLTGWGEPSRLGIPPQLPRLKAISGGGSHSIALTNTGTVTGWGFQNSLIGISGLSNITAVAAGALHSLALTNSGTVTAWGDNSRGQRNTPPNLSNVKAIATGDLHSIALTNSGMVTAWGNNNKGQCNIPPGLSNVVAIGGGFEHTLALTNAGVVTAWGDNYFGQITIPPGLSNVKGIAAGINHNLAITETGRVVAWGNNFDGECNVPHNLRDVVAVAAGGTGYSIALTNTGLITGWGDNYYGQTTIPPLNKNDFLQLGNSVVYSPMPIRWNSVYSIVQANSALWTSGNARSTVELIAASSANQTVFTLSSTYVPNVNNISIYSNGIRLIGVKDYIETSPSVVTLTQGVPLSTELLFEIGKTNTLPIGYVGDVGTFTSYISAPAVRGTFYGDGSNLTGITGGAGTANALPLSGGTLTGGLTGTTARFTDNVLVNGSITVPVGNYVNFTTNGIGHTAIYRNGSANGMEFLAVSASRMFIADAGNVGIGTTTPNSRLTVSGNISASGVINGNIATFSTSISAPALSGVHFGDGSRLTGIVGGTANALPLSGGTLTGTLSGTIAAFSNFVSATEINAKYFTEGLSSPAIVASAVSLDLQTASLFRITLNSNVTITFTNTPGSPKVYSFVVQTVGDGTLRSVTWPVTIRWPGGSAPTMTSTLNKVDTYSLMTFDGGTSWYGFVVYQGH